MNLIDRVINRYKRRSEEADPLEDRYKDELERANAQTAYSKAEQKFLGQEPQSPEDIFWNGEKETKSLEDFYLEEVEK